MNQSAVTSLEEGQEETLTLHRLFPRQVSLLAVTLADGGKAKRLEAVAELGGLGASPSRLEP